MRAIVVTGGAACGKSTAARLLGDRIGAPLFSADEAVHTILTRAETVRLIEDQFGPSVLSPSGELDRSRLRRLVFSSIERRSWLEALLHPRVAALYETSLQQSREFCRDFHVAEIPLFFESPLRFPADHVVAVCCSPPVQLERLQRRPGIDTAVAESILSAQMDLPAKMLRADVVIWNEGSECSLTRQIEFYHRILVAENKKKSMSKSLAESPPGFTDGRDKDKKGANPEAPKVDVPPSVFHNDLHGESVAQLHARARTLPVRIPGNCSKFQLIREILGCYGQHGTEITVEGVLEIPAKNGFGFLRWPRFSFAPYPDSVYVSPAMLRESRLESGMLIRGRAGVPRQREKFLALEEVLAIEGVPLKDWKSPVGFDKLTPLFPNRRIILENKALGSVTTRVIDLVAPLGMGQRGLIVAPPRSGKTIILKEMAKAIRVNHPEIELIILLIDERPEEVTDFRESVDASVFSSTFDENALRHLQVSDIVLDRAKRLVELKRDVVILLDSLTRLTRGYNSCRGNKGAAGSGGMNAWALQKARRFFSAARNVEEGGSLTIVATALVETESKMDEVIFEEFKGTGNLEIQLDRELVENRIFPAIHLLKSGTRKDDLLYHADEFAKVSAIRKQLVQIPAVEAIQKLVYHIENTSSNVELVLRGLKG